MIANQWTGFYMIQKSAILLKVTLFRECFPPFLNDKNGDKSHNASHKTSIYDLQDFTKYNESLQMNHRSSCPEVFCEKGILRNFAKFTRKNLCLSLFIKKETLAQVFSVNFVKFLRTPCFMEHLWWLLLESFMYTGNNLIIFVKTFFETHLPL